MSRKETASKSTGSVNELELVRKDKKTGDFLVKHRQTGNICAIVDTFAEMFPTLEISPANSPFFYFCKVPKRILAHVKLCVECFF